MHLYANKALNYVKDLVEFRNWNKNQIPIRLMDEVRLMDKKYNTT